MNDEEKEKIHIMHADTRVSFKYNVGKGGLGDLVSSTNKNLIEIFNFLCKKKIGPKKESPQ